MKNSSSLTAREKARIVRITVKVFAAVLLSVFGFLKFKGVPLTPFVKEISSEILLQISLMLYFSAWFYGSIFDSMLQEDIYDEMPHKGGMPLISYGLMASIAIGFGLLCVIDSPKKFALTLLVFLVINILGWYHMIKGHVEPHVKISRKSHTEANRFDKILELDFIENYIKGNWQWWRFVLGGILILLINLYAYLDTPELLKFGNNVVTSDFVFSSLILVFVLFMEIWILLKRLIVYVTIRSVRSLEGKYDISLRKAK